MAEGTMRERKKEATKASILNTAIDLINQQGFNETTMQMIAREADIALRTLYNYFPSKEAIVATYVQMSVKNEQEKHWEELCDLDTTRERLHFLCRISAQWMRENAVLAEVYTLKLDPRSYICGHFMADLPRSGLEELMTEILSMGQRLGDVTRSAPIEVLTRQFLGFYHFSVLTWLCDTSQDLESIFRQGIGLLFTGIEEKGNCPGPILMGMFC